MGGVGDWCWQYIRIWMQRPLRSITGGTEAERTP
jgi:hypothetical protein